jgi:hypothetical protein
MFVWPLHFGLLAVVFVNNVTVTLRRSSKSVDSGPTIVTLQHTTVISSSLYKCTDRRLLFITDRSRVYQPHPNNSSAAVLTAMLLLLGGVECNPGPIATSFKFGVFNVRGGNHSGAMIQDLIRDHQLQVLALSETWIREDAPDAVKVDMVPMGFAIIHAHRSCAAGEKMAKRGGGLAFIHSTTLSASIIKNNIRPTSFELQLIGLQVGGVLVKVANIYRPPLSSKSIFIDELADLLSSVVIGPSEKLILCGDLNMPGADSTSVDIQLTTLLDVHGFVQHVTEPTRHNAMMTSANLLDLVITTASKVPPLVSNVGVHTSHGLSDHSIVVFDLSVRRQKVAPTLRQVSYRNIKNINAAEFESRLWAADIITNPPDTPDEYVDRLESTVVDILDELAPLKHGHGSQAKNSARWISNEAIAAKRLRRKLERRWKSTGAETDRVKYRMACRNANALINASRNQHRYQHIVELKGDARRTWSAVKMLLHGEAVQSDGKQADHAVFCNTLATFFVNKVRNIRSAITVALSGQCVEPLSSDLPCRRLLSEFTLVTAEEVQRVLRSMSSKSSPLDFVPTSLLKACSGVFSQIIADLANMTFRSGSFPTKFRIAQITPLLKKRGLEENDPSSYRPISNLNTISKVLERLVLTRLTSHSNESAAIDSFQSAYRHGYSTETALLQVTSDIFEAFDAGESVLLIALDQSAAFDCIHHATLIDRLQHTYGLTGATLNWLTSYLSSRQSFVKWRNCSSDYIHVDTGVPQGSALGPQLFSMYIAPLAGLIRSFGVRYHQYADDTQLYISMSRNNSDVQLETLERCVSKVHEWLLHNGLALNPAKSEAVQFSIGRGRARTDGVTAVNVSGTDIQPAATFKSLGVMLDQNLSFNQQVDGVCKSCYFHIRALRHVRDSLPDDVATTVAASIVTSRLDYCNGLYAGMSSNNFNKLQRVQNTLARVVLNRRKFDHITPSLAELHWLPVRQRTTFKIATLTYKLLHSSQPHYLSNSLRLYQPQRNLRSSNQNLLTVTRSRTVTASRGFKHSSVSVWNSLPSDIRNSETLLCFRRQLKTFLFKTAFNI